MFVGFGGLRLAGDVLGDSPNSPIVFLPGAGQTRHSWHCAASAMANQGHGVISLDLRGHGESEWARDGDYSLDAFVGDALAVIGTLSSLPILIVASIGGIASLVALGESGERLARGLVLVDVVPKMSGEGVDRIRSFMSAGAGGFASVEDASAAVSLHMPHRSRAGTRGGLERNLRRGGDGRLYWHWDPAFHAGSKRRAEQGMLARMEAAASSIRVPTLLVSGAQSEVVDSAGAEHLLRLMPQAKWLSVKGAAHMVAGDDNDAFIAAVGQFVAGISDSGAAPSR